MSRRTPSTEAGRRLAETLYELLVESRLVPRAGYAAELVAAVESEARQQADGIDTERLARALMDMTQGWAESVEAMVDPGDYADGIPSVREFAAAIAEKYRLRGPQVRGGG